MIEHSYNTWSGGYAQIAKSSKGEIRVEFVNLPGSQFGAIPNRSHFLITIKTQKINKIYRVVGKDAKALDRVDEITKHMYGLLD